MTEPDSWIALAQEFAAIDKDNFLCLSWEYDSQNNRTTYSLFWEMPSVTVFIPGEKPSGGIAKARFRAYSAKACALLWGDASRTDHWFTELKEIGEIRIAGSSKSADLSSGLDSNVTRGLIPGICRCAEELCYRIAADPAAYNSFDGMLTRALQDTQSDTLDAVFVPPVLPIPPLSISDRLDFLAAEMDITHEALAHRIKIGKTAYFKVKAGRGGKSSRIKVNIFLDKYQKNQQDKA